MENDEYNVLLSATAASNLPSILAAGLRARSYWTADSDISAYYAETIEDEGSAPVILQVNLQSLDVQFLRPDLNGIEEPLTYTLGMSEEEISESWEDSAQTWQDSMAIIKTLRYDAVIPPVFLSIGLEGGETISLAEYMSRFA